MFFFFFGGGLEVKTYVHQACVFFLGGGSGTNQWVLRCLDDIDVFRIKR